MKAGDKMSIAFEFKRRTKNFPDWSVVAQGVEGGKDNLILTPVDPEMKSDQWPTTNLDRRDAMLIVADKSGEKPKPKKKKNSLLRAAAVMKADADK